VTLSQVVLGVTNLMFVD